MKKGRVEKSVAVLLMSMIMLINGVVSVLAADVMPCYDNVINAYSAATVSDDGELEIAYRYMADSETEKVEIATTVEKKTLVFFWSDVDSWTDTIYDTNYYGTESIRLDDEGTYRITVEYTFYGADGSTDTITYEDEVEY